PTRPAPPKAPTPCSPTPSASVTPPSGPWPSPWWPASRACRLRASPSWPYTCSPRGRRPSRRSTRPPVTPAQRKPSMPDFTTDLRRAEAIARDAGRRLLLERDAGVNVSVKGIDDVVTNVDVAVETFIRGELGRHFPDDGI